MDDGYANDAGMQENGKEEDGYCIEIYVGADNQVKAVKVEQKSMGDVEIEAKMGVGSIDEALSAAKGIYEAGGQLQGQPGQESAEESQLRGYGKGSFANQRGLPVNKVFSDTM